MSAKQTGQAELQPLSVEELTELVCATLAAREATPPGSTEIAHRYELAATGPVEGGFFKLRVAAHDPSIFPERTPS